MTPRTIASKRFLHHFCDRNGQSEKRFCFILGAGASRASGIKTGAELAKQWIDELEESYSDSNEELELWYAENKIDKNNPAVSYSAIYDKRFEFDERDGYAFLEEQMDDKEPSCGYAILAWILSNKPHNIVITPNFDSLTEDALFIYTKKKPLVVGHESLAPFIKTNMTRPLIVKIHRDILLSPKSSQDQTKRLAEALVKSLQMVFKHYTPVVIGYGGNDGSLMDFLDDLDAIPGGMFWCYRETDGKPTGTIANLVEKHKGHFVAVKSFDDLMIQIGDQLKVPRQDGEVIELANKRAETYRSQIDTITKAENRDDETEKALSNIIERSEKNDWWYYEQLARKQKNVDEKDAVYRKAIEQFPDSHQLLNNYAVFLKNEKKNMVRAEEYFEKALKIKPSDANYLYNYAVFLKNEKKDMVRAEEYYEKALKADPNQVNSLGNYANFLCDEKKDMARAEEYYQRALKADPNQANNLGNYAKFLIEQDKLDQSLDYLRQAFKHNSGREDLEIELWFYAYAVFYKEYPESREKIEELLAKGVRSPGWNLKGVLEVAKKYGHPDFEKLCEFERLITAPSEE